MTRDHAMHAMDVVATHRLKAATHDLTRSLHKQTMQCDAPISGIIGVMGSKEIMRWQKKMIQCMN